MDVILRMTGKQYVELKSHLLLGDGTEAVAVALCGRRHGQNRHCLIVQRIECIPHGECSVLEDDRLAWKTDRLVPLLNEASVHNLAIVKIQSHPTECPYFSEQDDAVDHDFFASVTGWVDGQYPHASAIMLPNGRIFGRCIMPDLTVSPLSLIAVAGADLHFWFDTDQRDAVNFILSAAEAKTAQAFGEGTVNLLRRLSIAVIGCSGTGSPVVEQLARLGVGRLVLIDPDVVEERNLNRILNTTLEDAQIQRPKVDVLARAIYAMGFNTDVIPLHRNLLDPEVVKIVAECDAVFGCMDGHEGRFTLNKITTYYNLPYIDIGIKLQADGRGGIERISGVIHYLQPDGSSLVSRRFIKAETVRAEGLRRTNPEAYEEQRRAEYIDGVDEERPAVISVNMLAASLAVNEFMARLHHYRYAEGDQYAVTIFELVNGIWIREAENAQPQCELSAKRIGRGDVNPLLDWPYLSEGIECGS